MKTLIMSHYLDVVKKEVNSKSEDGASFKNEDSGLNIEVKQEHIIKEEVDIPWDETICSVERGDDDVYRSEKNISTCNEQVIADKLPNSMHQNHSRYEMNENIPALRDPSVKYTYQIYLKICTTCNKRYQVVPLKPEIHECEQCKTPLIYDYRNCLQRYFLSNKNSVLLKTTMTLEMNSQIKKKRRETLQNDLQNKNEPKLRCSTCGTLFKYVTNLLRHFQICTRMPGGLSHGENNGSSVSDRQIQFCKKCDKELICANHIERKNNRKKQCSHCKSTIVWKCAECKKLFGARSGLTYHISTKHSVIAEIQEFYKCSECHYEHYLFELLVQHYRRVHLKNRRNLKFNHPTVTPEMHSCNEEAEYAKVQSNFDKVKYTCSKCEKTFESVLHLMRHIQTCTGFTNCSESDGVDKSQIVLDKVIVYCDKCDYELKDTVYIAAKKTINSTQNIRIYEKECLRCKSIIVFKCAECKRPFKSKPCLNDHIITNHSTSQEYKCSECDFTSRALRRLGRHYRRRHLSKIRKNDDIFIEKQRISSEIKSTYQCDHCLSKYGRKSDLRRHIRRNHLKGKSIECVRCSAKFQNDAYLREHFNHYGSKHHSNYME